MRELNRCKTESLIRKRGKNRSGKMSIRKMTISLTNVGHALIGRLFNSAKLRIK